MKTTKQRAVRRTSVVTLSCICPECGAEQEFEVNEERTFVELRHARTRVTDADTVNLVDLVDVTMECKCTDCGAWFTLDLVA